MAKGYSSPVSGDGRVFVHARRDPDEVVSAIDLSTGKVLWQQKYAAPMQKNPYAKEMAKGPYSTPLLADGRLYTLGTTAIVVRVGRRDGRAPLAPRLLVAHRHVEALLRHGDVTAADQERDRRPGRR